MCRDSDGERPEEVSEGDAYIDLETQRWREGESLRGRALEKDKEGG